MSNSATSADVVVIGGGPAGLTVAAEAARAGARVVVLERRTEDTHSRAGVIQPRVLELFDVRGLMDRFRAAAERWRPDFEVPRYIYAGLIGLRYDQLDSKFPYALILPQMTTEHLLAEWAVEQGVDLRRGLTYLGHAETPAGVTVTARDSAGDALELSASYLVGADGARSLVREVTGIPFDGHATRMTAVAVDAHLPFPWQASMQMKRNEHGWVLAYPFGRGITRFIIVAERRRHVPKHEPVTLDEVRESLRLIFGDDFGLTSAQWLSRYGDAHRMVPEFRRGRVLLAGEATRVHYPASGIGMNYCIQDAFNLGWKLGWVVSGRAPDALLDSYHEERHPVLKALMDDVAAQCGLHFDFSHAGLALKDFVERELVPIPEVNAILRDRLSGFGTAYHRDSDPHDADGARVSDFPVDTAGSPSGSSYTRVAEDAGFVLADAAGPAGGPRTLPDAITAVTAPAAALAERFGGAAAVLIRPDAYVARAWAARPTDEQVTAAYRTATRQEAGEPVQADDATRAGGPVRAGAAAVGQPGHA
ncbi:FAD-dependent oxidoreductase [Actinomadura syzygii]|uniref:FAD-dependent oxidoreductase n=1 Tax=Actinomadura syzygii TaxID=1427538 RepID=A0A5D0UD05_9ACTN|nr:FAD-dependent oxidoreductase [Actinomadura syzygii]TYC15924.1 FAD-dependent oxidoreductase [Actinomadura syzygii]